MLCLLDACTHDPLHPFANNNPVQVVSQRTSANVPQFTVSKKTGSSTTQDALVVSNAGAVLAGGAATCESWFCGRGRRSWGVREQAASAHRASGRRSCSRLNGHSASSVSIGSCYGSSTCIPRGRAGPVTVESR